MFQILEILPNIVLVISCYFIEDYSDDYVVKLCNYIKYCIGIQNYKFQLIIIIIIKK